MKTLNRSWRYQSWSLFMQPWLYSMYIHGMKPVSWRCIYPPTSYIIYINIHLHIYIYIYTFTSIYIYIVICLFIYLTKRFHISPGIRCGAFFVKAMVFFSSNSFVAIWKTNGTADTAHPKSTNYLWLGTMFPWIVPSIIIDFPTKNIIPHCGP